MHELTEKSSRLPLAMLLLAAIAGCGKQEDIRTYTVPRPAQGYVAPVASGGTGSVGTQGTAGGMRLLGAIIPREQASWYFKFMGPTSLVSQEYDAFVSFISSIKFESTTDAEGNTVFLPRWQLPTGWQHQPGSGMRFATITIGPAAHQQELTVFRFPGDSGTLMANIERWAGQVGLNNQTPQQIADMQRPITVDGKPATLVDMTGPGGGDSGMGPTRPPFANTPPPTPSAPPKIAYEVPRGWIVQDVPGASERTAAVSGAEGGAKAAVAIIAPAEQEGQTADPVANLNRWREQVGLAAVDRDEYRKDLETQDESQRKYLTVIMVGGDHALYADYTGTPENGNRVIGVMQPVGGYTIFYKLMGPAELVAKNRDAFGAFLQSVQYQEP